MTGLFWSEQDKATCGANSTGCGTPPLAKALHTERDLLGLEPPQTDVAEFRAALEHEDFPAAQYQF
ncbi:hypothetical protein [Calidithermus timidus]|jgi:hypothetical protein|uniref:hypothetical protein n=1 Tax=Calidithermus timidus TaxID=307124 RepID=UPI0003695B36|nr:hypothetical protein [Calidithermus timidus]